MALLATTAAIDAARMVLGDDVVVLSPRVIRTGALIFEDSIQGRIPAILGDSPAERVDTVVRLLRGTTEDDMSELVGALQAAIARLEAERVTQ